MQKVNLSGFPPLLENFDAIHDEIDAALKRTWLMLGGIALSSVSLVIYVLAFSN
jgi:hypothetical protein